MAKALKLEGATFVIRGKENADKSYGFGNFQLYHKLFSLTRLTEYGVREPYDQFLVGSM